LTPVLPQQAQPSQDESPLPQPKVDIELAGSSPLATPTPTTKLSEEATPSVPPEAVDVVELAEIDLAKRLGATADQVQTISVTPIEWPDTSLGCPQPGQMYAQVVTPGFLLVLQSKDKAYPYHTDRRDNLILCGEQSMTKIPRPSVPIEPGLEGLVNLAKEDLAQRRSISVDQIKVLLVRSVVWPDASLGCPDPDMRYRQVPMDGMLLLLSARGQVYEYHSGGARDPFLCEQKASVSKATPDLLDLTPPSGSESK
jgi:hypothetical protein